MFPDPAGVVKKVDTVYYTEQPKEITIEGIDLAGRLTFSWFYSY